MFPLYNIDGSSTCPFGMPMNQNRLAVPTWSYAMEQLRPARIIELGTWNGGFTTAIALHAVMIDAPVYTFDICKPDERIAPIARKLGVEFHERDIFASADFISGLIVRTGTTFVLCDGGDKKREMALFAPVLKSGDVIASHDYDACHEADPSMPAHARYWPWSEIQQRDAAPIAKLNGLDPWLQEHFDHAGWLAYRKR